LLGPFHGDQTTLAHAGEIRARLAAARGRLFAPDLVDAFLEQSEGDGFWLALQPDAVRQYQTEMEGVRDLWLVSWQEFKRCTDIFARILNAKSPHTEQHSRGVSLLARHLAGRMGMDAVTCERIEVAGLLHDIGKLQIPGDIIEADGALSADELELMKTHSRGTLEVLQRLHAIEEIARWASYHHETPDGQGYPFHVAGDALPLEARIINVADVFQALAQDRPYHSPLEPGEILAILKDRVANGKADATVVATVEADLDNCHRIALCRPSC
jgi:putative nucleotidyltransferase with HDIG domain